MSVGVHSGTFHLFMVGGSHRELVVAGPAWTRTVEMEHDADAGDILVSPETASLLPARCLGHAKGPGILLAREPGGHHGVGDEPLPEIDPALIASSLSVSVRQHVAGGGGAPEHRPVTIAFVHFDGTDERIATAGPAATAGALDGLVRIVQEAAEAQAVCFLASDVDADGGKLILTAGAPTVSGDDEERMLLAVRSIVDAAPPIPVRIGVNRGGVFAGDIGPFYRRTYTVMGDAVNLAARLMAQASPGEIYVSGDVLERSHTVFATLELEPFMVKGKAKPVQAWALGPPTGTRTRKLSHGQLPIVGREAELSTLREVLGSVRAGHGRFVTLAGESGIGKSRLVEQIREESEGLVLLRTACEAYTRSTPYIAWREILRELLDIAWEAPDDVVLDRLYAEVVARDPELLPWLSLIGVPFDIEVPDTLEVETLGPEFRRGKLHEVVIRFLALALDEPALIEIEDAQYMDDASADLLAAVVEAIDELPWLILATKRVAPGTIDGDSEDVLHLGPLADDDRLSLALLASEADPLPPYVLSMVAERSEGNPQFLFDLLQAARNEGDELPESVEAAAMAHIDRLLPSDRALVRRASVFGLSFHPRMLAWFDGEESESESEGTAWQRLGEYFEDDGDGYVRFRRAILRDAAYAGLPFKVRRKLHGIVGSQFETEVSDLDEVAGILSLHFGLAGETEKTWRYARIAARRAESMYAPIEAATLYARAIEAGRRLPGLEPVDLEDVYSALADTWERVGGFHEAIEANAAARKLAKGDRVREARLLYRRADYEESLGRYPQTLRWLSRGLTLLAGVAGPEAMRIRARLTQLYALVLYRQGRLTAAISWATDAVALAEEAKDDDALTRALIVLDGAGLASGDYSGGEHFRRALTIAEDMGDLRRQSSIVSNLGMDAHFHGDLVEAGRYFERSAELRAKIGASLDEAISNLNMGEILSDRGMYEEAEARLRGALRVFTAAGDKGSRGDAVVTLGRNSCRAGDREAGLSMLAEGRGIWEELGFREGIVDVDAKVAEAYAMVGETDAAYELAADAIPRSRSVEGGAAEATLERVLGFALAQRAAYPEAKAAFERSLALARDRGGGAQFDVVQAIDALVRLSAITGDQIPDGLADEERELLEHLGVERFPQPPLS
jgi:class 3 adenylate cyclase/tetratricopeptide (TPR) repeat protein